MGLLSQAIDCWRFTNLYVACSTLLIGFLFAFYAVTSRDLDSYAHKSLNVSDKYDIAMVRLLLSNFFLSGCWQHAATRYDAYDHYQLHEPGVMGTHNWLSFAVMPDYLHHCTFSLQLAADLRAPTPGEGNAGRRCSLSTTSNNQKEDLKFVTVAAF